MKHDEMKPLEGLPFAESVLTFSFGRQLRLHVLLPFCPQLEFNHYTQPVHRFYFSSLDMNHIVGYIPQAFVLDIHRGLNSRVFNLIGNLYACHACQ